MAQAARLLYRLLSIAEYSVYFSPSFLRGVSENWEAVGKSGREWGLAIEE